MSSLFWKARRLRAMGLSEIIYRVIQAVRAIAEKRGIGLARNTQRVSSNMGNPWVDVMPTRFGESSEQYLHRADEVIAGKFTVFSMTKAEIGFPPDWLKDPKTGVRSPLVFGKSLDYRKEELVGDIKYLWEPNRHLELVWLAQAWHLSGEDKYLSAVERLLSSWFTQNPYPLGPNWTSSLEHGIRLINWSFAWHLLGGEESPLFAGEEGADLKSAWLDAVYTHCFFISKHFSRYSSANNHLLGENAGLYVAALTWPCWSESQSWRRISADALEREALLQNAEDGGNREQATWYHHEVADMMTICALVGRANGYDFSRAYWDRLEALMGFLASIMDVAGNVPMIGDSDDALIVGLPIDRDVYSSLLATAGVLFSRADFKEKSNGIDDKTRWFLGDVAEQAFQEVSTAGISLPVKKAFPDSGYHILGTNFEAADEVRMIADSGPLGYLSIAAHGHSDALSLCLSVGGREVLVDPGTFAYHTLQKWRDYFKGTSAHNTVRVDSLDQSVSGGNFLWSTHANSKCTDYVSTDDHDIWSAEHDGYLRLQDPVLHARSVNFDKKDGVFDILDTLSCKGDHSIELHWHCSEFCKVELIEGLAQITTGHVVVEVMMPGCDFQLDLVCGQETPPLGWISRHFDYKAPASTIRWSGTISSSTELRTLITVKRC